LLSLLGLAREAKVYKLDLKFALVCIGRVNDIVGLDVSVDQAVGVHVIQREKYLPDYFDSQLLIEGVLLGFYKTGYGLAIGYVSIILINERYYSSIM
jgi:hypothetical protein